MFRREILSLMLVLTLVLLSCSGGGSNPKSISPGDSGVDTGDTTNGSVALSSNPTSLSTFGLTRITATVTNASGNAVADGTSVDFTLDDSSKGTLSEATATTVSGTAMVTFSASNTPGTVVISAASGSLSSSLTVAILPSSTSAVHLSASPASISISGETTITATAVDSTGNPVKDGTVVTYVLDLPSLASISPTNSVTSNGVTQTTLSASGSDTGFVTFTATTEDGITNNITIEITGGLAAGTLTLETADSDILTDESTTVTATVLDSSDDPVESVTVTFSLDSIAATLSTSSVATDSNGEATVTLAAGSSAATILISAETTSLSSSTTVNISAASANGSLTLSSSDDTIKTSGTTTITATLLNPSGNPLSGLTITLQLSNAVGTLSATSGTTNVNGQLSVTFDAGITPTDVTITGTESTLELSGSTTITIEAPQPASVSLSVNPSSITVFGTSTITATVRDSDGDPVLDGTAVAFSSSTELYGVLSSANATTANSNGTATTTFTASENAGTVTINATSGSISSTLSILVTPASTGSIEFVSAVPQVLGLAGSGQIETSTVTFTVKDINGNAVSDGTAVEFTMRGPGGGEYIGEQDDDLASTTGSTVDGTAFVTLHSGSVAGSINIIASTNISSGTTTTLTGSVDADDTTLPVTSTSNFGDTGRLRLDDELVDYTGVTGSSFTGVSRGASESVATSHTNGTTIYDQNTISSSATAISVGGGVPSAVHLTLRSNPINIAGVVDGGYDWINEQGIVNAYLADRFGNYNILEGTSVSFWIESGALDRSDTTDEAGIVEVAYRTQLPYPAEVGNSVGPSDFTTPAAWELARITSVNNTYGTSIPTDGTFHMRDGWVTVLATVQGEEAFADENANGSFDRSYATTVCPYGGYVCECDGDISGTNPFGWAGFISGGEQCTDGGKAGGLRSEGFIDQGEPFIDINDDEDYDDGSIDGQPFETYIDRPSTDTDNDGIPDTANGQYDDSNGAWDGPDCLGEPCLTAKTIWKNHTMVFTGSAFYCDVTPTGFTIANGGSQTFKFMVSDINGNRLPPGTTIEVSASLGGISGEIDEELGDRLSTGPYEINFMLSDEAPDTDKTGASSITISVSSEVVGGCTVVISGTVS